MKRQYIKGFSYGAEIEATFKYYPLAMLPAASDFDESTILEEKNIYMSKKAKVGDVKDRFVEILDQQGYPQKEEDIRFWKLDDSYNLEEFQKELKEDLAKAVASTDFETLEDSNKVEENGQNGGPQIVEEIMDQDASDDEEEKKSEESEEEAEPSFGLQFPGTCIEAMNTLSVVDAEVSSRDVVIAELRDISTKKWVFEYKPVKILGYGKCEYCFGYKPLMVQCKCKEVKYCKNSCLQKDHSYHFPKCTVRTEVKKDFKMEKQENARMGLTGLQNLGNTCFMNSSIQCLSNTNFLTKYFLDEIFRNEINEDNALGTGGKLALQYAHLLTAMWYESGSSTSPWSFKKVVGDFQPMFTGYEQHDSAELLTYVLDGLHEDLNRVHKKPYVEMPDFNGFSESDRAQYQWQYFLLRNQSIIVDLMYGQYKSTVECNKCGKISRTYDPFMMLSLPIPENQVHQEKYFYIPYGSNSKAIRSFFSLKKKSTVHDIRRLIAEQHGVDPWDFALGMVDDEDLEGMLCRNRNVGDIADNRGFLFAYELPKKIARIPEIVKKLKESGSKGHKENTIDDDYNFGLPREWIKVPVRLSRKMKNKYSYYERKTECTYTRIFWLNQNWTLERVHLEIFK